ncbi:GGDEF domain-containing protein [Methylobacterium sp. 10]|uniref:GGDEF domain-containing protein n=1 Tax=Methylobacterium sp. 10 TaxID=1101191 RepID=UPI0004ACD08A|nr:GGDEF domain-containing protein [Methylobacterium sp. 10]
MPDFYTLYLVVLIAGLSHCVLWATILYRYRTLAGLRYWLAGGVANVAGGILLAIDGGAGHFATTVGGNAIACLAFHLNTIGLRRFHGDRPLWALHAGLLGASVLAMAITWRPWWGQNPLYVTSQCIPLALAVLYLARRRTRELGAIITMCALATAITAHGIVACAVTVRLSGIAPDVSLVSLAAIDLLVFILAGIVWNFGFIVSVVDSLMAKVERLAAEDDLTGLPNRRQFMRLLAEECARETGEPFSVMLMDLDRFKGINDGLGHVAGDAALKHVADTVRRGMRSVDVFARLGGDEFGILLRGVQGDAASEIAEQANAALRASPFLWHGETIGLTISIGVTSAVPGRRHTPEELIECADSALYATKGRKRDGWTFLPFTSRPGFGAGQAGGATNARLADRGSRIPLAG